MRDQLAGVPGVDIEWILPILLKLPLWEHFLPQTNALFLSFLPHGTQKLVDVAVHADGEAQPEFQR